MATIDEIRDELRRRFCDGAVNFDLACRSQPHIETAYGPIWLAQHDCEAQVLEAWVTLWALHDGNDYTDPWFPGWHLELPEMPEGVGFPIRYCPFCGEKLAN